MDSKTARVWLLSKSMEIEVRTYLQSAVWQHKPWENKSTSRPNAGWTKHAKVIAASAVTSSGLALITLTTCL